MEGYATETASGGREALEKIAALPVELVVMDVRMPDLDGLSVLRTARETRPELPVVIMSGHGTFDTVREAFKLGAADYLEKPVEKDKLLLAVRNALTRRSLELENAELRREAGRDGENGTGKELVARSIHQRSRRAAGPFVKLNCAAVPAELIESELFGHERGAFTGAHAARKGKFELADGGSLFLDEVGDMPAAMQAKVLRVLQEGEFERVGGSATLRVDVRVVAATNKDLSAEVAAGRFREDLYYRLNVVPIHVPPLRERKEDLPELVGRFLAEACARNGRRPATVDREGMLALSAHDWPGNVRELRNVVERLVILADGPAIDAEAVLAALPGARRPRADRFREGTGFHGLVEEAEREIILGALAAHHDNVSETARALGLERSHLYKKMRSLGLKRGEEEA
jgi:DNA-binding NtrC family response regulator